jgi:hypothetical protein
MNLFSEHNHTIVRINKGDEWWYSLKEFFVMILPIPLKNNKKG